MLAGFPVGLIQIILCPKDGGSLKLVTSEPTEFAASGSVSCSQCHTKFEIQRGILRLMPGEKQLDPIAGKEQAARDHRADRYDAHFEEWENQVELSAILHNRSALADKTILDLACGTGRITTHLLPIARMTVAVDFSEQSLEILANKVDPRFKVGLIWSDATQLRMVQGSLDTVISTQLLEHIVGPEHRAEFFRTINSMLTPKGMLLLTAYYHNLLRRFLRYEQEGFHGGEIFYHRFSASELKAELGSLFRIHALHPIQIDRRLVPGPRRMRHNLARALEHTPATSMVGRLLFLTAEKIAASKA